MFLFLKALQSSALQFVNGNEFNLRCSVTREKYVFLPVIKYFYVLGLKKNYIFAFQNRLDTDIVFYSLREHISYFLKWYPWQDCVKITKYKNIVKISRIHLCIYIWNIIRRFVRPRALLFLNLSKIYEKTDYWKWCWYLSAWNKLHTFVLGENDWMNVI